MFYRQSQALKEQRSREEISRTSNPEPFQLAHEVLHLWSIAGVETAARLPE